MRLGIVGCGWVADYYVATLVNHPQLELAGIFDRDERRAERFASYHGVHRYRTFDELLTDPSVEIVANLTNPRSHFEVSSAALRAGKHVYSEKPLATDLGDAERLVELAESRGLLLAGAPCTVLGEAAQTVWRALRRGAVGTPRLVYAEMEDGPVPLENPSCWASASGAPWPVKDEFEVGCTVEHSGYFLTWLTAFFGPASRVTSFAAIVNPDKRIPLDVAAPDLTVAAIEFGSGVVARLTCGIFAPNDRRLRIIGDAGVLSVEDGWDFGSPVYLSRRTRLGLKAEKYPWLARWVGLGPRRIPLVRRPRFRWAGRPGNRIDFSRGIAELASALAEGRPPLMSARWSLHVTELALAIHEPSRYGSPHALDSSFEPISPVPWAR